MRGRSLIAAGLACLVSAVALGEEDLVRIGVLLIVLPLGAAAILAGTRLQLTCNRALAPSRVSAGSVVQVTLRLDNTARRATPALFAEDLVLPEGEFALSSGSASSGSTESGSAGWGSTGWGSTGWASTPRFALDRLDAGETRILTYTLRPPGRGRYELGPLAVRLCDPFGFCELPRMFPSVDRLLVTPEMVALPRLDPAGRWSAGATTRSGRAGGGGEDDIGTRPYRLGDEVRRVHWRTTARIGELSVRREEQPRQGSVTLLLDTRASAWPPGPHRGADGVVGGFETAVSVVASVAVALAAAGTGVHLLTIDGEDLGRIPGGRWTDSPEVGALLERLAAVTVGPAQNDPAAGRPGTATRRRPAAPLLLTEDRAIVVLGRRRPADTELLPSSTAGSGLALVVGAEGDLSALSSAGWLAASVPALAALPLIWQQLSNGPSTAAGRGSFS